MSINPPSLIKTYDEFTQFDAAFQQLGEDATDDEREAYDAALARSRETGNWTELIVVGQVPTRFVLRPLPGNVARALRDIVRTQRRGPSELELLYFRAALMKVENLNGKDYTAKLVDEPGVPGKIADLELANLLDSFDRRIVSELGSLIYTRAETIAPRP